MFHTILLQILKYIAKTIIVIHRPYIIGVTGTVGKSTITAHVGKFLSEVYGSDDVHFSHDHYNGEYGLPLTIIGAKTGGKNIFKWIYIFLKGISRVFLPFPRYLILEYGIDHPLEMDFLLSIAVPDIAILTEVAPNHLEQFGTLEAYRKEKLKILQSPKYVIVHNSLRQYVDREAIFYGIGAMSDIDISHLSIDESGTKAKIHVGKATYDILLPVFGAFHIENILPLYMIAELMDIDEARIATYLKDYAPESGRSGLLEGVHGSLIIDGSYNGGYLSIREGISSITSLLSTHRIFLLIGDMRELGEETEEMHKLLAGDINDAIPHTTDVTFFFVGPLTKTHLIPHLSSSYTVHHSLSSREMGKKIKKLLSESPDTKTVIFVKGSQNTIFLEEGIKEFLHPKVSRDSLCRQSEDWQEKKKDFFKNLKDRK